VLQTRSTSFFFSDPRADLHISVLQWQVSRPQADLNCVVLAATSIQISYLRLRFFFSDFGDDRGPRKACFWPSGVG